jgi:hypothetical protein
MPNVESAIVEPDVGFGGDGSDGQGGVEWDITPVCIFVRIASSNWKGDLTVVVGMDSFLIFVR